MENKAYTIRIFVPDGDPEGVRIIDRMNWTGTGVVFPRTSWPQTRGRKEFDRAGVYILVGYLDEDGDLPRIYVGEGDGIRERIENHFQNKEFWSWGIAFTSASGGLNKAHVQWLEYALVKGAREANLCVLDNGNVPQGPVLTEHEEADVRGFFGEMLRILPLVELRAFENAKPVVPSAMASLPPSLSKNGGLGANNTGDAVDTIVVPAKKEGFDRVFIGESCWYAIRISGAMLDKIKYIAAYQAQPISAITHLAPVKQIERYGESGKYRVIFSEPAKAIEPIPFADATSGSMQGPRYTNLTKLRAAKKVMDIFFD
jgi:hypothetical protein